MCKGARLFRKAWLFRETWLPENRDRIVLQRPRLLLYTDASDAVFLLADLQRRRFHDEGH